MAIWQFELLLVPKRLLAASGEVDSLPFSMDDNDLRNRISKILPSSASWSESILVWGEESGDRIQAVVEDRRIVELTARIDLRQPNRKFVEEIISLAIDCGASLATCDGTTVVPTIRSVAEAIRGSDSYRFVTTPGTFFEK